MAKAKTALFAIIFLLLMQFTVSAEPFSGPTEVVFVKDGDTFFQISMRVYTDEERSRGASWFAIYDFNVSLGSINSQRTPIVLGTNGLTVHIMVDQKLVVPHYLGAFPTSESVVARYGVQTIDGSPVDDFALSPITSPLAEVVPEPIPEPVAEAIVETPAEPESSLKAIVFAKPLVESLAEIVAAPLPEPVLEPESKLEPEAERIVEILVEPDVKPVVEPLIEKTIVTLHEPVLEPAIVPEATTGPVPEPVAEPVAAPLVIVNPDSAGVEKHAKRSLSGGLETFAMLGIGFYGDSLGFNAEAGVQSAMGQMFTIDSWPGNAILGVSVLYDGVVRDEIIVSLAGGDLRVGYRFVLGDYISALPDSLDLRLTPCLLAGAAYQGIKRSGRYIYQGLAWHLAPVITLDVSPFKDGTLKPLRAGMSIGYHYYFSTMVLQNFHAGFFTSWSF